MFNSANQEREREKLFSLCMKNMAKNTMHVAVRQKSLNLNREQLSKLPTVEI